MASIKEDAPKERMEFRGGGAVEGEDSKEVIYETEHQGFPIKIKKLAGDQYLGEVFDGEGKRFITKAVSVFDDEAIMLLSRRMRSEIENNENFVWSSSKSMTKKRAKSKVSRTSALKQKRFKRS